ncbi:MAG: TetR/AcrR family transcriptional regulator [Adlercreutzia sp.]
MAQQKGRTSKADATRRQLLDAAIEVISERGYADTTVERIVEVAGVSKGVAYYHFSSKADIATCILVEGIGEIVDDFVAIAGKAPSAVEALTAMMDSFAATIFRNAGFGRILVSELWRRGREWSEPMRALEERLLAVLRGQIERGSEGSIRGDIDAAFEAVAVVGMVLTTTLHYIREADSASRGLQPRRGVCGGGALAYRAHLRLRAPRQRVGGGRAATRVRRRPCAPHETAFSPSAQLLL